MGTLLHHHFFNLSLTHFIFLLLFSLTILSTPTSSRLVVAPNIAIPSSISYPKHCGHIVSESTPSGKPQFTTQVPSFFGAFVQNGDQLLRPSSQISANLNPRNVYKTSTNGVFKMEASLSIRVVRIHQGGRNLLNVHGGPRFQLSPSRSVRFQLSGFWDSNSGLLCMVGFGTKRSSNSGKTLQFDVVFKSSYPDSAVITTNLFTATLESLNVEGSDSYFRPISFMGFPRLNYEYTVIKDEIDSVFETGSDALSNVTMGLGGLFRSCYQFMSLSENFELRYGCDGGNCSQLDVLFGFLPRFMSLNEIDCSDQKMVRVAFGFSNTSDIRHGYRQPFNPTRALVAEGAWNAANNQLCFVACRILNFSDSPLGASVGDCSIRVNFTFPASLTVRTPSLINGHIWSNKSKGDDGYFERSDIRASGSMRAALPDMKYQYTEIERAKRYCTEKREFKRKGKAFPDPYSQDMKFDFNVRNSKGQVAWGRARSVFVGDRFVQDVYPYFRSSIVPRPNSAVQGNTSYSGSLNLTYQIALSPKDDFKVGGGSLPMNKTTVISAEGIYDTEAGRLCMVGCWNRETGGDALLNANKQDCDIFVNFMLPPRDSNGEVAKGTIESKRAKSDPLYFERLDFSATSLTTSQVESVFWRMDFEITMVLISNTLTCIFVGLQLFHVKRQPEVLPFISIIMLVVITLGHMIPLLLNMEAFFLSSPSKKTMLFGSGGWLEVNEVLVRVITMVAFLLEFRLLQLAWYARGDDGSPKNLWASETKVVWYSLPVYAGGVLIAWIVQRFRGSPKVPFRRLNISSNPSLPFWRDVKSYAGFVLDAFLLPQIMFNVFSDSKDKVLSLPFYVGTTIVRLLPHAYDLFRAHSSTWKFDPWYIYANPGMNYYSTVWDILISCLGLVLVVLIYLQQRFGGRSVLPKRFREHVAYEQVPVGL